MSATALDIWPDNDREFKLAGVKTVTTATGATVNDDSLSPTVFVSTSDAPDATAIPGASVTGTSIGNGKYLAKYDGLLHLPLATMRTAVASALTATLYLHWVSAGNFHVVQELAYAEIRPAT